ncbi:cupin domain-containing protein [Paracoccus zhejiangensis]|uniref:XRE family transcriptional regulator n=1 Tax=Paracoccus zhejiangensis TaxID=1077935 RepID=A0A2H5F0B7_9RHOB|nr:cupin domain-containing protein [Paracoccus zhejiangensis]AUH64998.1 XRE family transcriptional regulator [Paracoccus zhejiangensis]
MAKIGRQLKELRSRRQLSIRVLAARSGVSHSTISLIERDQISPTIDTLGAILDALGTTIVGFMSSGRTAQANPFYRADDLPEIGGSDGISYKIIGLNFPARQIQFLKESYRPGADSGGGLSHAAEEAGYVLAGRVELTVGEKIAILEAGDAYYFDSRQEHRFRNIGGTIAEIVSAVTPPNY